MNIFVKRLEKKADPVSGKLSLRTKPSQNSYLIVKTADGLHLEIAGQSEELLALFRKALSEETLLQDGAGPDPVIGNGNLQPVAPDNIPMSEWSSGRQFIYDRLKRALPYLMD